MELNLLAKLRMWESATLANNGLNFEGDQLHHKKGTSRLPQPSIRRKLHELVFFWSEISAI